MKNPPFSITNNILNAAMRVTHLLGELDGLSITKPKVMLRKSNTIKTIQASLAIEGNTLSLEQVSDILEGVPVLGPEKDILEVKNAIVVYEKFSTFHFNSLIDLKKAHHLLMQGLITEAGCFRSSNVGVFAGSNVAHVAPQHKMVPNLMKDLFSFLKRKDGISLLIKSCIFHYELEFIHPFSDGNGRMGRLWQHLILFAYHRVFEYVVVETLIKNKQKEYYAVLGECDRNAESTAFIEFSLNLIEQALWSYRDHLQYQPKTPADRLSMARQQLNKNFSRKDYLMLFKNISTATASRDLKFGIEQGFLEKNGDRRVTTYYFKY
ncbi:MAG: cell filamentation protein Fic [Coxiella sp. RIFCSPHIGHO2_12_FULL_42_15]|nr:MAG: cell filamentation protein Fic [Coxiella sp. RIFCSPHIGHO2_12_FULL_42_15]